MKIYRANRRDGRVVTVECPEAGNSYRLPHVCRHSPDGFNWGYGGSGPSDLALSILNDFTWSGEVAEMLYQSFKWEFIAQLKRDEWILRGEDIHNWIVRTLWKHQQESGRKPPASYQKEVEKYAGQFNP